MSSAASWACRPPHALTSATTCRTFRSSSVAVSPCRFRMRRPPCATVRITLRSAKAARVRCARCASLYSWRRTRWRRSVRLSAAEKGPGMDRRGAFIDRLVAWSPVFLLGGLAALTYWLHAQVQADTGRRGGTARHDADMYIENFRAVSYDAEGKLRQSLAAKRAEHHPDDESVDFTAPSLALTDPGRPRMSITAEAGTLSGDRETVTFRGAVRAVRDALPEGARAGNEPKGPI